MNNSVLLSSIVACIDILSLLVLFLYSLNLSKVKSESVFNTRFIARIGVFASISAILYCVPVLKFSIPGFPSFLEIHFDEIPAFFAGFAYGPLSALAVIFIKTIIKLPMSSTLCVGELTDLLLSIVFVLPASLIYKHHRKFKGALLGILSGTILQVILAMLVNVYIMLPFYMFVMGFSNESLLLMMQSANALIKDISWSYAFFAVLPFNLIKNVIIIVIVLLIYKPLHRLVEKIKI